MMFRVSAATVLLAGLMTSTAFAKDSSFGESAFSKQGTTSAFERAATDNAFARERGAVATKATTRQTAASPRVATTAVKPESPARAPAAPTATVAPTAEVASLPSTPDAPDGPVIVAEPAIRKLAAAGVKPVAQLVEAPVDPEKPVKSMEVVLSEVHTDGYAQLEGGAVAYAPPAEVGASDKFADF